MARLRPTAQRIAGQVLVSLGWVVAQLTSAAQSQESRHRLHFKQELTLSPQELEPQSSVQQANTQHRRAKWD